MVRIVKRALLGDLHRHPIKKSLTLETPNGHVHHFSPRPRLKHRFKRFLKRIGILSAVLAAAVVCQATSPTVPKFDGPTQAVRGAGARLGDDLAVRCVNAAGTAFESCAGSGGAASGLTPVSFSSGTPTTPLYVLFIASQSVNAAQLGNWYTSIVSTFSQTNPGYVQFPSAQAVTLPSGQAFVVLGTTFTVGNPGYVQFPSAQAVTLPAGQSFVVLGTTFTLGNPGYVQFPSAQSVVSTFTMVVPDLTNPLISYSTQSAPVRIDTTTLTSEFSGLPSSAVYDKSSRMLLEEMLLILREINYKMIYVLDEISRGRNSNVEK